MRPETALSLKALLVATAAFVLADAATADAANLVSNPDFTGTSGKLDVGGSASGWLGSSGAGVSTFGAGGIWDNATVPGQGTGGDIGYVQGFGNIYTTISGLNVGEQYTLTFYANARTYCDGCGYGDNSPAGDDNTTFNVTFGSSNPFNAQAIANVDGVGGTTDSFTLYSAVVTATAGTETLTFANLNTNPNGLSSLLVGDVSMSEVPEPMSLSLLGCGIAGLTVMRRRRTQPSSGPGTPPNPTAP
jgi:hypothetical protein